MKTQNFLNVLILLTGMFGLAACQGGEVSDNETNPPTPTDLVPTPHQTLDIGSTMVSEKDGMILVYVPKGDFEMGSEEGYGSESPVHTVFLDAFWIDRTEVTNAMYEKCVEMGSCELPHSSKGCERDYYYGNTQYSDFPVICVDWYQAKAYCEWAGRNLPTEAEWEKAAKGTDGRTYPWGEGIDSSLANYNQDVGGTTAVGSYPNGASIYGAFDMAGNASEWILDWKEIEYYINSPYSNPTGPSSGEKVVVRGGSWSGIDHVVRSAYRNAYNPAGANLSYGFRCAAPAQEESANFTPAPANFLTPTPILPATSTPGPSPTHTALPTQAPTTTPVSIPTNFSEYFSAEVSAKLISDLPNFTMTYPTDWVIGWGRDEGLTYFSVMSNSKPWNDPNSVWLFIVPVPVGSEGIQSYLDYFTGEMIGETIVDGLRFVESVSNNGENLQISAIIVGDDPTENLIVVAEMPLSGEELYRPLIEKLILSIELYSKIQNAVITVDPPSGPIPTTHVFSLSEFQANETVHVTIFYQTPQGENYFSYETTLTLDENGNGEFSLNSEEAAPDGENWVGEYLFVAMGYLGSYAEVLFSIGE